MTIDDRIAEAAGEGAMRLTLFPTSSGYQASLSVDGQGWRVEMADSPILALNKVLGLAPGASGKTQVPAISGAFD